MKKRIRIYIEWRDVWVGLFVSRDYIYYCPLPCLVVRWTRKDMALAQERFLKARHERPWDTTILDER